VDDQPDDVRRRLEKLEGLPAPCQAPPAPRRFVDRIGPAEQLRNVLLDDDAAPLMLLYSGRLQRRDNAGRQLCHLSVDA
jgi:hypothetical protein